MPPPVAQATASERLASALASAAILAGLALVLLTGLRPAALRPTGTPLTAILVTPDPPRPAAPPPPPAHDKPVRRAAAPRDAAAPPAARSAAAAIVAPPPRIVIEPPPLTGAMTAGLGLAVRSGAAAAGSGNGAGGLGQGTGGGGAGGDGTGGGIASHARQRRGQLSPRDLPDGLIPPGGQVSVGVRFTVTPEGLATACRIIRSSGSPAIDAVPCPLLERRYRFRPARDRMGQATSETLEETHTWFEPDARP